MVKSEKIKNIKAVYISIENNKIFIYLFIQNGFYLYNSEIKATDFQLFFDAIPNNENYFDLQKDIDFIYDKLIEIYPKPNKYFYQISNSNSDKYIRKFKRKFKFSHKLKFNHIHRKISNYYGHLGEIYFSGSYIFTNFKKDYDNAFINYKKAVEWNKDEYYIYILAYCYYNALGTKCDFIKSIELFSEVIESKREYISSVKGESCYYIGKCYKYGFGVSINKEKAITFFKNGATFDNKNCLTELNNIIN